MRRSILGAIVAGAIAAAFPSLANAVTPELPGRVVGMSQLPDHVQDAVRREASHAAGEIGELRAEPHGLYRVELQIGEHGEILTLDRNGTVIERTPY
jgi:hypothetical protein